jgi:hypothetical protein
MVHGAGNGKTRTGPSVTRDTSHREIFEAYGTAREDPCKAQALSGDIPGVNPGAGKVCPLPTTHNHKV